MLITILIMLTQLILRFEIVHSYVFQYSRTSLLQLLVIWFAIYLDRRFPLGKFVENSTKLTCLDIAGYQIKYSTVLWLLDLQLSMVKGFIRRYML